VGYSGVIKGSLDKRNGQQCSIIARAKGHSPAQSGWTINETDYCLEGGTGVWNERPAVQDKTKKRTVSNFYFDFMHSKRSCSNSGSAATTVFKAVKKTADKAQRTSSSREITERALRLVVDRRI
jgi:glycerol-3-phosphate dehydrogenase